MQGAFANRSSRYNAAKRRNVVVSVDIIHAMQIALLSSTLCTYPFKPKPSHSVRCNEFIVKVYSVRRSKIVKREGEKESELRPPPSSQRVNAFAKPTLKIDAQCLVHYLPDRVPRIGI